MWDGVTATYSATIAEQRLTFIRESCPRADRSNGLKTSIQYLKTSIQNLNYPKNTKMKQAGNSESKTHVKR